MRKRVATWFGRHAGLVKLGSLFLLLHACSSCDGPGTPAATATTNASAGASVTPPAARPTVDLVATVPSKPLGEWPKQAKALSTEQVVALLPGTEGARIELVDAGLEPRELRRHKLRKGDKQELLLELDLGLLVTQDGETTIPPVPALTVEVALTTVEVKQDVAQIQFEITKAAVVSRGDTAVEPGGPPRAAADDALDQIRPLVKKLPGIRAILRVTAQGIRARSPEPPKDTPIELRQLWSTVAEAVSDAIVAFPSEPIGAGAKWTVLDRQERAGVVMLRRTQLTLLDITGPDIRLSGEVVEAAIQGSARDPALPKEIKLEVIDGVTVGKRRFALRGSELWPLASLTELSSDLQLRATATAGAATDTKTSKIKLTQILKAVRRDVAAKGQVP